MKKITILLLTVIISITAKSQLLPDTKVKEVYDFAKYNEVGVETKISKEGVTYSMYFSDRLWIMAYSKDNITVKAVGYFFSLKKDRDAFMEILDKDGIRKSWDTWAVYKDKRYTVKYHTIDGRYIFTWVYKN